LPLQEEVVFSKGTFISKKEVLHTTYSTGCAVCFEGKEEEEKREREKKKEREREKKRERMTIFFSKPTLTRQDLDSPSDPWEISTLSRDRRSAVFSLVVATVLCHPVSPLL